MSRRDSLAVFALVGLVLAVFAVTVTFDFVDFDDRDVVLDNPFVAPGITWDGLAWAWGVSPDQHKAIWYNWPLTWLSHQLDCQMFGLWGGGHHVTNVVLHAAGTAAVFAVLRLLGFSSALAFVLAAVYGVHPAQIESVAWVTSRKNVLSALFVFLAVASYLRSHQAAPLARRPLARVSWNVLGMAAMLSKATVVTLPAVLMLLDWWPLRRLRQGVGEKIPLLAFAALTIVAGYRAQDASGAVHEVFSPLGRIAQAARAIAAYLGMFVAPYRLSPLYLRLDQPPEPLWTAACGIIVACLTISALIAARHRPAVTVGWFWFLGTLVPVVGIVEIGIAAWACRHLQIPMVGLLISIGGLIQEAFARRIGWSLHLGRAVAAVMIAACVILTFDQLAVWRDAPSLARAMLDHNCTDALQWNNLAIVLDRHVAAPVKTIDRLFLEAESLPAPADVQSRIAHDYGRFLLAQQRNQEACTHFRRSLELAPAMAAAQAAVVIHSSSTNLAVALTRLDRHDEALRVLEELHAVQSPTVASLNAQGNALMTGGDHAAAQAAFERALAIDPDDVLVLCNAATAAARAGHRDAADRHLERAWARDPQSPAVTSAAAAVAAP